MKKLVRKFSKGIQLVFLHSRATPTFKGGAVEMDQVERNLQASLV